MPCMVHENVWGAHSNPIFILNNDKEIPSQSPYHLKGFCIWWWFPFGGNFSKYPYLFLLLILLNFPTKYDCFYHTWTMKNLKWPFSILKKFSHETKWFYPLNKTTMGETHIRPLSDKTMNFKLLGVFRAVFGIGSGSTLQRLQHR